MTNEVKKNHFSFSQKVYLLAEPDDICQATNLLPPLPLLPPPGPPLLQLLVRLKKSKRIARVDVILLPEDGQPSTEYELLSLDSNN